MTVAPLAVVVRGLAVAAPPCPDTHASSRRYHPSRRGSFCIMGVLGEMFPGRKIADEAGEDGDAQPWRLGPIDLDRGVVQVHRAPHSSRRTPPAPNEPTPNED
jgi:hypothetical protein